MIKLKLLLCAQGVVRDADSNNLSVFNILESIQAAGFPMFIQQMDILALLERSDEDSPEHDLHFRVTIDGTELVDTPLPIDFQDKPRNRATVHVQGLVIPTPGTLSVAAEINGELAGTYDLLVEQIEGPKIEARQDPEGPSGAE